MPKTSDRASPLLTSRSKMARPSPLVGGLTEAVIEAREAASCSGLRTGAMFEEDAILLALAQLVKDAWRTEATAMRDGPSDGKETGR
jgi:hypothetical protein